METLQHISSTAVYGTILCLTGFLTRYIVGNRRFNRRGIGGLQHYSSYAKALFITTLEWLISLTGFVLILFGFLLIAVAWYNNHGTAKHGQPTTKAANPTTKK